MRRWFWLGFVGLLVAGVVVGGYVMFTPKIGHATAAQIDAALPASLKVKDRPDPEGEARYERLAEILKKIDREPLQGRNPSVLNKSLLQNEAVLAEVEGLLREGGLRVPSRSATTLYKEATSLKEAAKLMSFAIQAAQERGDKTACGRWGTLGLRYVNALKDSQGVVIDALVHVANGAIVHRAIYLAEINGGFDASGRAQLLSLLTPEDGTSPAMADAVRRDFQTLWMPLLLDPDKHAKDLVVSGVSDYGMAGEDGSEEPAREPKLAGTFDPLDTARLGGRLYAAMIDDLRRPFRLARREDEKVMVEAERGLPSPAFGGPEGYLYRIRMNLGKNTLGRQGVSSGTIMRLGDPVARAAATRNLVRAVIQLRMGQRPNLPDPYGTGKLRFDTKRKIVWSVGQKGTDDGGVIGTGWQTSSADYGCPYGDRSWTVPTYTVPSSPSPGFSAR